MTQQFKKDVELGLSLKPKSLPSKYFYDKIGDALFVDIMHLPEYYVTRAEQEIFKTKVDELIDALKINQETYFELIELGAGDGLKTKELLKVLDKDKYQFDYFPIDISQNSLDKLEKSLKNDLPNISVEKKQGDYFKVLESLKGNNHLKIVLFLGSNIGNMNDKTATEFIYRLGANLQKGDHLILGADLIKSADIVLPAYDDEKGITAAFNLNLLQRINRELEGDFDLTQFEHQVEYKEKDGIVNSFLVSKLSQKVHIRKIGKSFEFEKGEKLQTEISRKYNDEIIRRIIEDTNFEISHKITDSKNYFTNYILERVETNR